MQPSSQLQYCTVSSLLMYTFMILYISKVQTVHILVSGL